MPIRLLQVGTTELKLVEKIEGSLPYAVLSHCWGKVSDVVRTTTDNLHQHLQRIDCCALPKSFHDAVEITRKLDLEYLWIDSLCIVQDDGLDWEKESASMSLIFANAYVTLAATASKDSNGGLLFDRPCARPVYKEHHSNKVHRLGSCRLPSSYRQSLYNSPLNQRGWVLQEMLLSNRIIHFAAEQLFWQCRSCVVSEDGYVNDVSFSKALMDLGQSDVARKAWWTWIEDYSTRLLTWESDKFAALAGLTKVYQEQTGVEPIAGLWADDLNFDLLWCAGPQSHVSDQDIATWSWVKMKGSVKALLNREGAFRQDAPRTTSNPNGDSWRIFRQRTTKVAKLLGVDLEWSGQALTSKLIKAKLRMYGPLRMFMTATPIKEEDLRNDEDYQSALQYIWQGSLQMCRICWTSKSPYSWQEGNDTSHGLAYCRFDVGTQVSMRAVFFLHMNTHHQCSCCSESNTNKYCKEIVYECLMVEPADLGARQQATEAAVIAQTRDHHGSTSIDTTAYDGQNGSYRRLGVAIIPAYASMRAQLTILQDVAAAEIELV